MIFSNLSLLSRVVVYFDTRWGFFADCIVLHRWRMQRKQTYGATFFVVLGSATVVLPRQNLCSVQNFLEQQEVQEFQDKTRHTQDDPNRLYDQERHGTDEDGQTRYQEKEYGRLSDLDKSNTEKDGMGRQRLLQIFIRRGQDVITQQTFQKDVTPEVSQTRLHRFPVDVHNF